MNKKTIRFFTITIFLFTIIGLIYIFNLDDLINLKNFNFLQKKNAELQTQINSFQPVPAVSENDYQRGAKNPTIFLVEYSDFDCPFCHQFHPTMKRIIAEYPKQVAWVYRHLPLSIHPNAQKVAETAECVGKLNGQKAFWKFVDLYFEGDDSKVRSSSYNDLADLASEIGANGSKVKKCLDNKEMTFKVTDHKSQASAAGAAGTPSTFLITKEGEQIFIQGALQYDQLKQIIEDQL